MSVKLKAMFGAAKYQGKKIFLCLVYRKYKGNKKKILKKMIFSCLIVL